jgi:precorrin-3B synthase
MPTRAIAQKLAAMLPALGVHSAHVSGCPKGCARSAPADLVLVGGENGFGLVRNGCAGDPPQASVSTKLDTLPARLRELGDG